MTDIEALQPAIIYLGAGLASAFASQAVKLSPIVGYLAAGVVIGPHGLGLVEENETTALLAEMGVVFLLFDIGLHFSLHEMRVRRRDILGFAPAQLVLCGAAFAGLGLLLGWDAETAVIVGVSLALSSTAVVSRILADRHAEGGPTGRSATAVLVAQDIAAIFLLAFAAARGTREDIHLMWLAQTLGFTIAGLAIAVAAGRLVVRPLFRSLAATNNREAFTVVALFIVLAGSAATARAGLSLTLGAFLAGMALSDTPYRHVVQHEVKPFQGLLLGLFFMSVGMGVDVGAMAAMWPAVLGTAAAILLLKTAMIFAAAKIVRWRTPAATGLAFLLSQGSEFTLVVAAMPAMAGAMPGAWASIILAAVALTLVAAPIWTELGSRIAKRLAARERERGEGPAAAATPAKGPAPVMVFGMSEEARFAVDALRDHHIPHVAVDNDPERFVDARSQDYDVVFGDPRDTQLMDKLGARQARAVVIGAARMALAPTSAGMAGPPRFIAAETPEERESFTKQGYRAHVGLAEPKGAELATDLLTQLGVERQAISLWLAEQADRRGLQTPVAPPIAAEA